MSGEVALRRELSSRFHFDYFLPLELDGLQPSRGWALGTLGAFIGPIGFPLRVNE